MRSPGIISGDGSAVDEPEIVRRVTQLRRTCTSCDLTLPLTDFRNTVDRTDRSYRSAMCRTCEVAENRPLPRSLLTHVDAAIRCTGARALLRLGPGGGQSSLRVYAQQALAILDGQSEWPMPQRPDVPPPRKGSA